jgi:hypothetical protein
VAVHRVQPAPLPVIPPATRKAIVSRLLDRGEDPTERNIEYLWREWMLLTTTDLEGT